MTFSICVRENYEDGEEVEQVRYGIAVLTRLPRVGALCPFVNRYGAVSTQSRLNRELGQKGASYLTDGLGVEDALQALLNADPHAVHRQLHGVDRNNVFAYTGEECDDWAGHVTGDNYSIAGNLLRSSDVVEEMETAYLEADPDVSLPRRLAEVLRAGQVAGGDGRDELGVQSAAIRVEDTEEHHIYAPATHDLRVDATTTPIADLDDTLAAAERGHEETMAAVREKYARME